MTILYQDSFSRLACEDRFWLSYAFMLIVGCCLAAIMLASYIRATPSGWKRTVFAWGAGMLALFAPIFAFIPAVAEQTSLVLIDGQDLVRNSCHGRQSLTERHRLSDISTSLERRVVKGSERFALVIRWPRQARPFALRLHWDDPLMSNLAAFAPEAIAAYADALRDRNIDVRWTVSGKPVGY